MIRSLCLLFVSAAVAVAATPAYRKLQLSDQFFSEGAAFGDLNKDGVTDVVSGPYWYAGPEFKERHEIYQADAFDPLGYSNDFFTFTHDFNGDGWTDVLVLGFPGVDASWFENPGQRPQPWRRHVGFVPVDNESPTFADVLGTGQPVLLCTSGGRIGYASYNPKDSNMAWTFHAISPPGPWQRFTHGLGFGDVNGDGRADILEKTGWWEQPADLKGDPVWTKHEFAFAGAAARGGAQMHVVDVNGDGLGDVVTSIDAHGYGLSWFEQVRDAGGAISFREHVITSTKPEEQIAGVQFAQLHAIAIADVDGDGLADIVTGKRWWAHGPKGDVDPNGTPVLYAFLLRRGSGEGGAHFEPLRLDDASGIGTQVVASDANGDGVPDIVVGNKRGTFVFLSEKASPATGATSGAAPEIAKWKAALTEKRLALASASHGRDAFARACASCHSLFGSGRKGGSDLTMTNRADLDYLLATLANPRHQREPVAGKLAGLPESDVLDLVVYLRSKQQVPLPQP